MLLRTALLLDPVSLEVSGWALGLKAAPQAGRQPRESQRIKQCTVDMAMHGA
jgi:hypothetical protein